MGTEGKRYPDLTPGNGVSHLYRRKEGGDGGRQERPVSGHRQS